MEDLIMAVDAKDNEQDRVKCGIIMPISAQRFGSVEYSESYWQSMLKFLRDVVSDAGYEPVNMWAEVPNASITPRIIENIFNTPLAIAVISCFNPNVMMELGMRLAACRPVLIIADDSVKQIPFDIHDLELCFLPFMPLYSQYETYKLTIQDRLKKMCDPNYRTYMSNYTSRQDRIGQDPQLDSQDVIGKRFSNIDDSIEKLTHKVDALQNLRLGFSGGLEPVGFVPTYYGGICGGRNLSGAYSEMGPTGPAPLSAAEIYLDMVRRHSDDEKRQDEKDV